MRQGHFESALQPEDVSAVWRFLVYELGADRADDACQDVFAEATRRFADFDPGRGTLTGWLIGFARNVVRRYHAAPASDDVSLDDGELIGVLLGRKALWSPGDMAQGLHRLPIAIREILRTLPELDRKILWKTTIYGLPSDIVAARLDMGQSAVTTRLNRIRTRLRPMLITPDDGLFGEAY